MSWKANVTKKLWKKSRSSFNFFLENLICFKPKPAKVTQRPGPVVAWYHWGNFPKGLGSTNWRWTGSGGFWLVITDESTIWVVAATQIFVMFTPKIGEDEPILANIFQMGWNHQLEIFWYSFLSAVFLAVVYRTVFVCIYWKFCFVGGTRTDADFR